MNLNPDWPGSCRGRAEDFSHGADQWLAACPASRLDGFCFGGLFQEFVLLINGQIEVTAAILARLNVVVAHQRDNDADGNTHVATRAYLMAHHGDSFFTLVSQAIVVLEDWRRDFSAQSGNRGFRVAVDDAGKLKLLELEQILKKFFHGTDFILRAETLNPENEEPAPRSSNLRRRFTDSSDATWFISDQCCLRGWRLKPLFVTGGGVGALAG